MNGDQDKDDGLARLIGELPETVAPSRELWGGVAARIEAKRRRAVLGRRVIAGGAALLAAAAVLVAVRTAPGPVASKETKGDVITAEPVPPRPVGPIVVRPDAPMVPEEASYGAALATIGSTLDERLLTLPGKDAEAIRKSLRVIHEGIDATRAALQRDPNDADLRAELDDEYEQEIQTMNDVLDWTTRS